MNIKVSVEHDLELEITPQGIMVGQTLITWGLIFEQPETRRYVCEHMGSLCAAKANAEMPLYV